jgi:hypothetical protein
LKLDDGVPLEGLPSHCQFARKSVAANVTVSQAGDTKSKGREGEVEPAPVRARQSEKRFSPDELTLTGSYRCSMVFLDWIDWWSGIQPLVKSTSRRL